MNKAVDFVKKQIDEFEERVFRKDKESRLKKNDSKTSKIENLSAKEFSTEPFGKNGKLKPNIKYSVGEHKYFYETDELGRIANCSADELLFKGTSWSS